MKINKQKFLKISLGITMMLASIQPSITLAEENFPSRSMKLVVGYAAGGPADTLARLVAEGMSSELGQTMIVENRPGAASAIAASYVAKSPADGYTLIWGASSPMVMNPIIRDDLDYDPINDFDQLGMIADMIVMIAANNDADIDTLEDLINKSQKDPNKYFYGSSGIGTAMNIAGEKLKKEAKIEMEHVPYTGSAPNMVALMSGEIQLVSDLTVATMPLIRANKIKPIAVMSKERLPEMPDVPAVSEILPGFEFTTFQAVQGPAGMPTSVRERLENALREVVTTDSFKEKLQELQFVPAYKTGEEAKQRIEQEIQMYTEVVKEAGITIN